MTSEECAFFVVTLFGGFRSDIQMEDMLKRMLFVPIIVIFNRNIKGFQLVGHQGCLGSEEIAFRSHDKSRREIGFEIQNRTDGFQLGIRSFLGHYVSHQKHQQVAFFCPLHLIKTAVERNSAWE